MSNQNDAAIEAFKRQELRYQQDKAYERIRKQYQMEMDNYHSPWQRRLDRSYTQKELADREKEMVRQLQQFQGLPEPAKEYRKMAEQVRCERCKWKNPDGCWECSGTGISPIPFAEVMKLR